MDQVLLNQGDIPIMVSTTRHHGASPPPQAPPGQDMQGTLFTKWTPDKRHASVVPNATFFDGQVRVCCCP